MSDPIYKVMNDAIFKDRDSKDGIAAVQNAKRNAAWKNINNMLYAAENVQRLKEDNAGPFGDKSREKWWRARAAKENGIREFEYDERNNNHILFVDDVQKYSTSTQDYAAFNQKYGKSSSLTVVPYKHSKYDKMATPRERIKFDNMYFHEQSHAKGNSGARDRPNVKYDVNQNWAQRPEEHLAEEGTLKILKENMDRANMPYNKDVGLQSLLDYYVGEPVKNNSSLLYRDRMEYLPNPKDNMEAVAKKAFLDKKRPVTKFGKTEWKKINNSKELQLYKSGEEIKRRASGFNIKYGDDLEDRSLNRKLMAIKVADNFENSLIKLMEKKYDG